MTTERHMWCPRRKTPHLLLLAHLLLRLLDLLFHLGRRLRLLALAVDVLPRVERVRLGVLHLVRGRERVQIRLGGVEHVAAVLLLLRRLLVLLLLLRLLLLHHLLELLLLHRGEGVGTEIRQPNRAEGARAQRIPRGCEKSRAFCCWFSFCSDRTTWDST